MAGKTSWKQDGDWKPCKCGCGTLVQGEWKRGHARRGRKNSEAHRAAISKAQTGKPMHPNARAALLKSLIGRERTEEVKKKWLDSITNHYLTSTSKLKGKPQKSEHAAKSAKSRKGLKRSPETRRKGSESLKKKYKDDPIYRAMVRARLDKIRERPLTAEDRKKMGNGMRGKHHTDAHKQEASKRMKLLWATNAEYRKKATEWLYTPRGKRTLRLAALKSVTIQGKSNTVPERLMAQILDDLGVKYAKQRWMMKIEHFYPADFYTPLKRLVIEVDGKFWHKYPVGRPLDHVHDAELKSAGYKVIRFWEGMFNIESVRKALEEVPDTTPL